jgi:hypothetical protein
MLKNLGRYFDLGSDEKLTITGVRTEKIAEYSTNPFLFVAGILRGRPAIEQPKDVMHVSIKAKNDAGEQFSRTYRFTTDRWKNFVETMTHCAEENASLYLYVGKNKLPRLLPYIV